MNKGTVNWFNEKKGYGFIIGEDNKEVFVHYSGIIGNGFKRLSEGAKVTYDLIKDEKGRVNAINVVKDQAK